MPAAKYKSVFCNFAITMRNSLRFIIAAFLVLLTCPPVSAQKGKVPPFRMVLSNGKVFNAHDLPLGKPIIIIYFSPDCEDCQKMTDEILARINDFKNVSIAMITYLPVESVSKFVAKNKLNSYSNFYVGTERPSLFVKNYYNIGLFPFVALYTMSGDLVKKYTSKEINIGDLSTRLKLL